MASVPSPECHRTLGRRLDALGEMLRARRTWWSERPFVQPTLRWEATAPRLASWLRTRSADTIARYEASFESLKRDAPSPLPELIEEAESLIRFDELPAPGAHLPQRSDAPADRGVSKRKHDQIRGLVHLVEALPGLPRWVDWCAGKGHLGRRLGAWLDRDLVFIERDPPLCDMGRALDEAWGRSDTWICADVHDRECHGWLHDRAVIALHACGALHRRLLDAALEHDSHAVVVAPCCYHADCTTSGPIMGRATGWTPPPAPAPYVPQSRAGRSVDPELDEHALRLATSGKMVASASKTRLRERSELYRMILSEAVAEATSRAIEHVSLPTLPKQWFRESAEGFVERAAERFGLYVRIEDVPKVQGVAAERLRVARALNLVRAVFRRPIEVWLALDLGSKLSEHGHLVDVVQWCQPTATPRNLAIVARRVDH